METNYWKASCRDREKVAVHIIILTTVFPCYLQAVPPEIAARLHFYNWPVSPDPSNKLNPLNIIRQIVQPGDFVVSPAVNANSVCQDNCIVSYISSAFNFAGIEIRYRQLPA